MARTLLIAAAALSLLIAPLVLSQDSSEDSPPLAEDRQLELERLFGELQPPSLRQDRLSYRVVPDVGGAQGSWTCLAQADPQSPEARGACDFGRELSRMQPCTRPEDCQALDLWSRQVGPPSMRKARWPAAALRPAVELTRPTSDEAKSGSEDADPESVEDEN